MNFEREQAHNKLNTIPGTELGSLLIWLTSPRPRFILEKRVPVCVNVYFYFELCYMPLGPPLPPPLQPKRKPHPLRRWLFSGPFVFCLIEIDFRSVLSD